MRSESHRIIQQMGKRKRQSKRARRTNSRRVLRRALQAGPLRLEQVGTEIFQALDSGHPDFAAYRRALHEEISRTPQVVCELRDEIATLCEAFHAFDVICATWTSTATVRPGTLTPYHPEASPATASYVAHVLLLQRDDPKPTREPTPDDHSRGIPVERITTAVADILHRLPAYFALRQGAADAYDPYLQLRTQIYGHNLIVRSFAYEWQERETLQRLFDPFADVLRTKIGFDAQSGLKLAQSLGTLQFERINELVAVARQGARKMKAQLHRRRVGEGGDSSNDHLEQLLEIQPKDAQRWIDHSAIRYVAAHLGRAASFSALELAEAAGVEVEAAEAFIDAFSVDFGGGADADAWRTDPAAAVGGEMAVMRRRPIVHDGAGRYLPAAVDSVFYGLRDVLTDAIKSGGAWKRFNRHRGKDLETRAVQSLAPALRPDWHYQGVKYWSHDNNGTLREGEADAILRIDTIVLLIEAKSGSMDASARRAAPARLERCLRDLVVSAHEQLQRAERTLVEGHAERVCTAAGTPLSLDVEGVTRVLRIAVSLEDLSSVAPAAWQLGEAGLLPDEELTPWTVGIHELELICSLADRPAQLLHYLVRRRRTYRQRIWAMDEMDLWMRYLSHGLWWEDEAVENRMIQVASHTDALDAWAYGQQGLRPKSKRPRQKLDRHTRTLLDAISATGATGRLEAQIMLLEMSGDASKRIASELRRSVQASQADGDVHRSTFVFGDDMVVTVAGVPDGPSRDHMDALAARGLEALDQYGCRRWLGLVSTVRSSRSLTGLLVLLDTDRLHEAQ
jgi:hypothetical protein